MCQAASVLLKIETRSPSSQNEAAESKIFYIKLLGRDNLVNGAKIQVVSLSRKIILKAAA